MLSERRLPARGEIFLDSRGDARALRVTWHPEAEIVVVSFWRDRTCAASFRLPIDDVPDLIGALSRGLADAYGQARASYVHAPTAG